MWEHLPLFQDQSSDYIRTERSFLHLFKAISPWGAGADKNYLSRGMMEISGIMLIFHDLDGGFELYKCMQFSKLFEWYPSELCSSFFAYFTIFKKAVNNIECLLVKYMLKY